jgi:hypothetical protein
VRRKPATHDAGVIGLAVGAVIDRHKMKKHTLQNINNAPGHWLNNCAGRDVHSGCVGCGSEPRNDRNAGLDQCHKAPGGADERLGMPIERCRCAIIAPGCLVTKGRKCVEPMAAATVERPKKSLLTGSPGAGEL